MPMRDGAVARHLSLICTARLPKPARQAMGIALVALLLGACAGPAPSASRPSWEMTREIDAGQSPAPVQKGRVPATNVVFVRQSLLAAKSSEPLNVYVNGHYLASLIGDTYAETRLCPGRHRMAAAFNDVENRYATKMQGLPLQVRRVPNQYVLVQEDAATGQARLQAISEAQARSTLASGTRSKQIHSIPRIAPPTCGRR